MFSAPRCSKPTVWVSNGIVLTIAAVFRGLYALWTQVCLSGPARPHLRLAFRKIGAQLFRQPRLALVALTFGGVGRF